MGSRCWECGTKIGRCYEHGGVCDCPMPCRCTDAEELTLADVGATVLTADDVALMHAAASVDDLDYSALVLDDEADQ